MGWAIIAALIFAGGSQLFGCNGEKPAPPPNAAIATQTQSAPTPEPLSTLPSMPSPAPSPTWRNVYITGHRVPIRSDPNAKSKIIDRVENGRLVVEYERSGDWVLVEHPVTARRGWIAARRISLSQPAGTEAAQTDEEDKPKKDEDPRRTAKKLLTDAAIIALLIRESLAEYHSHSPCACPFDRDRRGRACGARSAWSRPGGYSPLCYPKDVTTAAVTAYRDRMKTREADAQGAGRR